MHAARNGHPSTVKILINYGANVLLTNGLGNFLFVICIVRAVLCCEFVFISC